jgi:hypothetical protein
MKLVENKQYRLKILPPKIAIINEPTKLLRYKTRRANQVEEEARS